MTVKELKEKLNQFDDNLMIMIPNRNYLEEPVFYVTVRHISQGINEFDGCVFIDDYEEDE